MCQISSYYQNLCLSNQYIQNKLIEAKEKAEYDINSHILYIEFIPNDIVLGQLVDVRNVFKTNQNVYNDYYNYKVVYFKLIKDMFLGQIVNYNFSIISANPLGKSTLQNGFNFKKSEAILFLTHLFYNDDILDVKIIK